MSTPNEVVVMDKRTIALRDEFNAKERRLSAEMSSIVLAARAKAEVEARYVYAERNPRDMDDVRVQLKTDCTRIEFAKAARYKIPNRGEGFTIRFVERALALMGNIYSPSYTIYEDEERRIIRATVMDLERNVTWERDVTVMKTVERTESKGREVVRHRMKADGGVIAIVRATDEELLTKEGAAISKAQRTNGQRIIPPGLLEEAKTLIAAAVLKNVSDNPDTERKAIADAFASIGVMPSHLKEYLGCELGQIAPAELVGLRELYSAIREGHTTWREVALLKKEAEPTSTEPEGTTRATALKNKIGRPKKNVQDGHADSGNGPLGAEPSTGEAKPSASTEPGATDATPAATGSRAPERPDAAEPPLFADQGPA